MTFKANIYITKVLEFLSKAMLVNSFLLISLTRLIVSKLFAIVYDLQISFASSANFMFALLKDRKSIFRTIFILMSVNKKVFRKNQPFFRSF